MKCVSVEENRIFIDVAESGCGGGCRYCYVESAALPQRCISIAEVDRICDTMIAEYKNRNYILSFCPNTEPFKSQKSKGIVTYMLRTLAPFGFYFQISTKEYLSLELLEELHHICCFKGQIFMNISIPFIKDSDKIEPGCGAVTERIKNFRQIHRFENLSSCLYMKPFFPSQDHDFDEYDRIVREYAPDYICVGASFSEFIKELELPCTAFYKTENARRMINGQNEMIDFAKRLESSTGHQYRVRFSSICNIIERFHLDCPLVFNQYHADLCRGCGENHGRRREKS